MTITGLLKTSAAGSGVTLLDRELAELVDALVEAVDTGRWVEIDRLRSALEPFGAASLFDAELRLNGTVSIDEDCICRGDFL